MTNWAVTAVLTERTTIDFLAELSVKSARPIYAVCSAPGELSSTWFVDLIVARLGVAGSGCPRCGAVGAPVDVGIANRVTRPSIPQPVRKPHVFSQRGIIEYKY